MSIELKLEKGSMAYFAQVDGKIVSNVMVSGKRVSKYGAVTYYVKVSGRSYHCTFDKFGGVNCSSLVDFIYLKNEPRLCDSLEMAEKWVKYFRNIRKTH